MTIEETKKETPIWVKTLLATIIGLGGASGASFFPVNYNAKAGYQSVQEAYPTATIETRSWAPYTHKVHDGEALIVIKTSIVDGSIIDRW